MGKTAIQQGKRLRIAQARSTTAHPGHHRPGARPREGTGLSGCCELARGPGVSAMLTADLHCHRRPAARQSSANLVAHTPTPEPA